MNNISVVLPRPVWQWIANSLYSHHTPHLAESIPFIIIHSIARQAEVDFGCQYKDADKVLQDAIDLQDAVNSMRDVDDLTRRHDG